MYFHPKICSCPYGNKWQHIAVIYTFLCISSVKICSCPEKYAVAQKNMQLPRKVCSCPEKYAVAQKSCPEKYAVAQWETAY